LKNFLGIEKFTVIYHTGVKNVNREHGLWIRVSL